MSYPVFRSAKIEMDSDSSTSDREHGGAGRGIGRRGRGRGRGPFGLGASRISNGPRGGGSNRSIKVFALRNTAQPVTASTTGTTAALSKTLRSITLTKISKLQKQRGAFTRWKEILLKAIEELASDQPGRVKRLVAAVQDEDLPTAPEVDVMNILRWVEQSYVDTSVPRERLVGFEEQLRGQLDMQTRRLDLADLYSRLLREWLTSSNMEADEPALVEDDAASEESFEVVKRDR